MTSDASSKLENARSHRIYWASITRQHLNAGYEPVLIFCNDPVRCLADNRRVFQPHTEQHAKLIYRGGERRTATYGDGAYKLPARLVRLTNRGPHSAQRSDRVGQLKRSARSAQIGEGIGPSPPRGSSWRACSSSSWYHLTAWSSTRSAAGSRLHWHANRPAGAG